MFTEAGGDLRIGEALQQVLQELRLAHRRGQQPHAAGPFAGTLHRQLDGGIEAVVEGFGLVHDEGDGGEDVLAGLLRGGVGVGVASEEAPRQVGLGGSVHKLVLDLDAEGRVGVVDGEAVALNTPVLKPPVIEL